MAIAHFGWSEEAACRGSEGSLFFSPETSERKDERHEREQVAKRICMGCEVRDDCLEAALERREPHGIWGGMNELERRGLVRS